MVLSCRGPGSRGGLKGNEGWVKRELEPSPTTDDEEQWSRTALHSDRQILRENAGSPPMPRCCGVGSSKDRTDGLTTADSARLAGSRWRPLDHLPPMDLPLLRSPITSYSITEAKHQATLTWSTSPLMLLWVMKPGANDLATRLIFWATSG